MEIPGEVVVNVVVTGTTAVRPEDMTAEQRRRWLVLMLMAAARAEYARARNSEELP